MDTNTNTPVKPLSWRAKATILIPAGLVAFLCVVMLFAPVESFQTRKSTLETANKELDAQIQVIMAEKTKNSAEWQYIDALEKQASGF